LFKIADTQASYKALSSVCNRSITSCWKHHCCRSVS
jgi:hypothetical protein